MRERLSRYAALRFTTSALYGALPCAIAAIGPKYLPCRVITAWRCLTICSGFICGNAVHRIAAAPKLLTQCGELLVRGRGRLVRLLGVIRREALHVRIRQVGGHAIHHGALAQGGLAFERFEVAQLLGEILGELAGDFRICRGDAVAVRSVACGAHL